MTHQHLGQVVFSKACVIQLEMKLMVWWLFAFTWKEALVSVMVDTSIRGSEPPNDKICVEQGCVVMESV